ncbi:MAG: hypothetical protein JNM33_10715 [Rubrivivax sp.]|nr:hypothetical protein [Rubrivivax sp.]
MKFQPDSSDGVNVITRQEAGRIWVGTVPFSHSILVPWQGEVQAWGATQAAELTVADFERLAQLKPEVVIFGSGARIHFVPPALQRVLFEQRIGVETMDTAAACRTYNVLASERRRVLAALLLQPPTPAS